MLDRTKSCNGFGVWWQAQEVVRMNMILVPEIVGEAKALVALAFRIKPASSHSLFRLIRIAKDFFANNPFRRLIQVFM